MPGVSGKRPPPRATAVARATHRRSREARRSRFLLVGGALLSSVILGAWFPANALYHQHASLASAKAQLNELHEQDAALAQERKNLSDSAEIARIAREQYQLVSPGQQAFEVLPPTGSSDADAPYSGDPALSAPGCAVLGIGPSAGFGTTTTQPATATPAVRRTRRRTRAPPQHRNGVLGRIVYALEFWR